MGIAHKNPPGSFDNFRQQGFEDCRDGLTWATIFHAQVMKSGAKTLSRVRCVLTRQWGEIHNFSNSGEALSLHCDVHAHMAPPGASQAGDTVRGGKGTQKVGSQAGAPLAAGLANPEGRAGTRLGGFTSRSSQPCSSCRALQVTVKDSCWQRDPESPPRLMLFSRMHNFYFSPCGSRFVSSTEMGITKQVFPGPHASHSLAMRWMQSLCPQCCLTMHRATQAALTALDHTISSKKKKNSRSFGWSVSESDICTHFFSCFVPLMTIQEQGEEIPETS